MSKLRTGSIFTPDILDQLTRSVHTESEDGEDENARFREKTHSLQKFLQHGMSRFSIESFRHILDSLVTSSSDKKDSPISVRSLGDLRMVVKMTMMKREAGSIKASDANALMYMENFFYAIYCMTEAKKLFDEIYGDLFFCYYNPDDMSRQATRVPSSKANQGKGGQAQEDYRQFGISTLEQMSGSTHHKLRHTVRDLQEVLARWSSLLTDEEPQLSSFESESEQDIHQLRAPTGVQPVLRLLPDMFAKFFKGLELMKQWWVLAHEVYPDLPFQRRPSVSSADQQSAAASDDNDTEQSLDEIDDVTDDERSAQIKKQIMETKLAIKSNRDAINSIEDELDVLAKRDEKFEILMETYEKVGQEIEQMNKERQELLSAKDHATTRGNIQDAEVADNNLRDHDNKLRMLEFQHALLLQDYMIQLEVRPSIIRFQGETTLRLVDLQAQQEKLESTLESLQHQLERFYLSNNETNNEDDISNSDITDVGTEVESPDRHEAGNSDMDDTITQDSGSTISMDKKQFLQLSNDRHDFTPIGEAEQVDSKTKSNSKQQANVASANEKVKSSNNQSAASRKLQTLDENQNNKGKLSVKDRSESSHTTKSQTEQSNTPTAPGPSGPTKSKDRAMLAKSKSSKDVIADSTKDMVGTPRSRSSSVPHVAQVNSHAKEIKRRESMNFKVAPNYKTQHVKSAPESKKSSGTIEKESVKSKDVDTRNNKTKSVNVSPERSTPSDKRNPTSRPKSENISAGKPGAEIRRKESISREKVKGSEAGILRKDSLTEGKENTKRMELKRKESLSGNRQEKPVKDQIQRDHLSTQRQKANVTDKETKSRVTFAKKPAGDVKDDGDSKSVSESVSSSTRVKKSVDIPRRRSQTLTKGK